MKIDIIIPVKNTKVRLAIKKTIPSVFSHLPYRQVFVVTQRDEFPKFLSAFQSKIQLIDEDQIVNGLTISKLENYFESKSLKKERAGWYFQQFLKFGISKSSRISDLYLVWEADNVALKPISFFSSTNEVLYDTTPEYHKPYFELIEKLLGIKKQVDYSFISEHYVFDKNIVIDLLSQISDGLETNWWIKILEKIDFYNLPKSGFSEYELYGNFIAKYYPEHFKIRKLSKVRNGTELLGMNPSSFSLFIFSLVFDYISFEEWQKKYKPLYHRYLRIMKTLFLEILEKFR